MSDSHHLHPCITIAICKQNKQHPATQGFLNCKNLSSNLLTSVFNELGAWKRVLKREATVFYRLITLTVLHIIFRFLYFAPNTGFKCISRSIKTLSIGFCFRLRRPANRTSKFECTALYCTFEDHGIKFTRPSPKYS